MSFNTKTKMWWGTVKSNTEHFFGKDQKRMVTHEYYDNPNAPSQRPKSMHTISSQSKRNISSNADNGGNAGKDRSAPKGFNKKREEDATPLSRRASTDKTSSDMFQEAAPVQPEDVGNQQYASYPGEGFPQGDPNAVEAFQGGMDPNGMMYPQQDPNAMMYPQQDPNMMMYPQQDPNMMMYPQQDPNMMMYQQPGMYPEENGGYPQQQYPQQQYA